MNFSELDAIDKLSWLGIATVCTEIISTTSCGSKDLVPLDLAIRARDAENQKHCGRQTVVCKSWSIQIITGRIGLHREKMGLVEAHVWGLP